jgi:hypothetical protein
MMWYPAHWLRENVSRRSRNHVPKTRRPRSFLKLEELESRLLPSINVLTYHYDIARTGLDPSETILTTSNVNSTTFGLLFVDTVDGKVDAQPLYMAGVVIPGLGTHNEVFVATEHDSVYAFDADNNAGANASPLWHVSLLPSGEVPSDPRGCNQVTPEIGITATPVIDPTTNTMYVVAMSKTTTTTAIYHQRLHALDITTGADKMPAADIQASFTDPITHVTSTFDPKQYKERDALLLLNGIVYLSFASHCDIQPYQGWVMGYRANTLSQASVLNITPNGSEGAFWNAGAGPAADSSGNIYNLAGNGTFDTTLNSQGFPNQDDFGNGFLKFSAVKGGQLHVSDYFAPFNTVSESNMDQDLGSGGVIVLPPMRDASGVIRNLVIGAGKDGNIYLADRNNMGKFNSQNNNNLYQELAGALSGGEWATSAYFNGAVYYGPVGNHLMRFTFSQARLNSSPASQTGTAFGYPGTTPAISPSGKGGIVWAAENGTVAVLHAYDALNLANELYNSNQAPNGRDHFGTGNKFITPMIANGKVYVATTTGIGVFGLLAGHTSSAGTDLLLAPVQGKSNFGQEVDAGNPISRTLITVPAGEMLTLQVHSANQTFEIVPSTTHKESVTESFGFHLNELRFGLGYDLINLIET